MSQFFTSNTLIKSIKRRAMVPENQATFTDEDFLAFSNEEISMGMVPMILRLHEDFFLVSEEVPIESNKSAYSIPKRAIGNKLREISYKDQTGNIYEMTRIGVEDLPHYNSTYSSGSIHAFYVKNNKVVLQPEIKTIPATGTIVFSYFMRPNEMVAESRAAQIESINTTTGEIVINSFPIDEQGNQLFSLTTELDFIERSSPHVTLTYDLLPTSIDASTRTMVFGTYDSRKITFTPTFDGPDQLIFNGTVADNGSYFTVQNEVTGTIDVFWFNIDSLGVAPSTSGTLHEVAIASGNTATANAIASKAVLDAVGFTNLDISILGDEITITENTNVGKALTVGLSRLKFVVTTLNLGEKLIPDDTEIGDYINLACECIVPQIPSDLHMQLAQRVAVRCLEAMGDMQGVQIATAKLQELDTNAGSVIDNRVEGAPRKVVNRHGILRQGLHRRRFRFRS